MACGMCVATSSRSTQLALPGPMTNSCSPTLSLTWCTKVDPNLPSLRLPSETTLHLLSTLKSRTASSGLSQSIRTSKSIPSSPSKMRPGRDERISNGSELNSSWQFVCGILPCASIWYPSSSFVILALVTSTGMPLASILDSVITIVLLLRFISRCPSRRRWTLRTGSSATFVESTVMPVPPRAPSKTDSRISYSQRSRRCSRASSQR